MKCLDAQKLLSQIDAAIVDINSFTAASTSEQSYMAKFLVVFIAGIYEECVETIINEMVKKIASPEISNFIESTLDTRFRNPDMGNIKGLLKKFNSAWYDTIDAMPKDQKDALDSIYTNKNGLSHGSAITITLIDVLDYYNKSRVIIEKIDDILL